MISFKNFLTESKSAPLYHGTYFVNIPGILEKNKLEAHENHGGYRLTRGVETVSLTRSLATAINWKSYSSSNGSIVLQLDQQKLAQNYKIYPIEIEYVWARQDPTKGKNYVPKSSKLYEEYVTKDIDPLDKYLQHIIITGNMYSKLRSEKKWNMILNHPKLKVIEGLPKSERRL